MEDNYPDTKRGVCDLLMNEREWTEEDLVAAKFEHGVPGHWIVTSGEGHQTIVYLAGHGGIEEDDWIDEYYEYIDSERAWFDSKLASARGDTELAAEYTARMKEFEAKEAQERMDECG